MNFYILKYKLTAVFRFRKCHYRYIVCLIKKIYDFREENT